jgi:hypothetical protein
LHLDVFEQPEENHCFNNLLEGMPVRMSMRAAGEKRKGIPGNARGGSARPRTAAAPASSLSVMLPMILTALQSAG